MRIDDFLSYLESEMRYSTHTVDAYRRDLQQFAAWLTGNREEDLDAKSVTLSDIRAWLGSLAGSGMAAATLRRKTQSLRAFYKWGQRRGLTQSNPASDMSLSKKRRKLPNIIRPNEIEQLLAAPDGNQNGINEKFADARRHIIIELLYSLGLRQAELLALTDRDIDYTLSEIKVTGKRNKQRILPLPAALAADIKQWQSIRDARYELQTPKPLIAGPHGALSKQQLYKIVHEALASVSAGRRSPHTLRHTFATAMIGNGADLDAVREMLGHSSLATTQIYTHLSASELLKNYHTGHPRSSMSKTKKA